MHSKVSSVFTSKNLSQVARSLISGNLVAFPTETVYGLGADACNAQAVARIYEVKGRPSDHPLIVHISTLDLLEDWAREIPDFALELARAYWPGPMTLILKRSKLAGNFLTGGQETIGLRIPNHPVALKLLMAFEHVGGKGVAAPSANRFGQVSPTSASAVIEELAAYLSIQDLILDGGLCAIGLESTIIDCTGAYPRVLRPGAISVDMIEEQTKLNAASGKYISRMLSKFNSSQFSVRVSGSLEKHYSPAAKILLDQLPKKGQGLIAMSGVETPPGVIRLATPKTHLEYAQILYASLRAADARGLGEVVVAQPIGQGIAIAIRDRLKRAANGR